MATEVRNVHTRRPPSAESVGAAVKALDRLNGVARAQGADVCSLGLVRCAQDAAQAVGDRHRLGLFNREVARRRSR